MQQARGFLSTTEELLERSLTGEKTPVSLCYIYNARPYTLTLQRVIPITTKDVRITLKEKGRKIDQSYRDLKESQFQIYNQESGAKTDFSVLLGTTGELRGVPVQINYQPNWWFQIVLNLKTQPRGGAGRAGDLGRFEGRTTALGTGDPPEHSTAASPCKRRAAATRGT